MATLLVDLPRIQETEEVTLANAAGRVLIEPLRANHPLPLADCAAMDGIAVYHKDLNPEQPTRLPLIGRLAAGGRLEISPQPGTAVRIFTGAWLPAGPDTVIKQEELSFEEEGFVRIPPGHAFPCGSHIRRQGEDLPAGTAVLPAGTRVTVHRLGLLAALGCARIRVVRQPRVALLSSGDEVREAGQPLNDGCLPDSNRPLLRTLLSQAGCQVEDLGIAPDRPEELRARLAQALARGVDAIVATAGACQGEEDHTAAVLCSLGGDIRVRRLNSRPGQPVVLARLGTVPFLGLPGNPVAAALVGRLLAVPVLDHLGGALPLPPRRLPVRAGFAMRKPPGRREFLMVTVRNEEGHLVADKLNRQGSGMIAALAEADGILDLPVELERITPGDVLMWLPF